MCLSSYRLCSRYGEFQLFTDIDVSYWYCILLLAVYWLRFSYRFSRNNGIGIATSAPSQENILVESSPVGRTMCRSLTRYPSMWRRGRLLINGKYMHTLHSTQGMLDAGYSNHNINLIFNARVDSFERMIISIWIFYRLKVPVFVVCATALATFKHIIMIESIISNFCDRVKCYTTAMRQRRASYNYLLPGSVHVCNGTVSLVACPMPTRTTTIANLSSAIRSLVY